MEEQPLSEQSKKESEPGSSKINISKNTGESRGECRARAAHRGWKGFRGSGSRGFRRRASEWNPRNKRWQERVDSGGTNEFTFVPGGSLRDPLNLNSVKPGDPGGDDEIEAAVEEASRKIIEPQIWPKNPRDPLNLRSLIKNRNKRKRRNSKLMEDELVGAVEVEVSKQRSKSFAGERLSCSEVATEQSETLSDIRLSEKQFLQGAEEPNVEPDVVYPVTSLKDLSEQTSDEFDYKKEKKVKQNEKFRYGNFDRYYGCRIGQGAGRDPRLSVFRKEWFEKKAVLDIGCNVGYITLWIAKEYAPRRILGIDIDEHLVGVARKNIRHYCDKNVQIQGRFPVSFAHRYGPISAPPVSFSTKFPDNVWFRRENYVLECDEYLDAVREEFDVILALSITKWIHLNWGDDGLKRFFKRAFKQLRSGGKLILEPQDFQSYYRRAKLTVETHEVYKTLKFMPEKFREYLISDVGFESCENIDIPKAKTKGFERPIQIFYKKLQYKSVPHAKPSDEDCGTEEEKDKGAEKMKQKEPKQKRPKLIKFEDAD